MFICIQTICAYILTYITYLYIYLFLYTNHVSVCTCMLVHVYPQSGSHQQSLNFRVRLRKEGCPPPLAKWTKCWQQGMLSPNIHLVFKYLFYYLHVYIVHQFTLPLETHVTSLFYFFFSWQMRSFSLLHNSSTWAVCFSYTPVMISTPQGQHHWGTSKTFPPAVSQVFPPF